MEEEADDGLWQLGSDHRGHEEKVVVINEDDIALSVLRT